MKDLRVVYCKGDHEGIYVYNKKRLGFPLSINVVDGVAWQKEMSAFVNSSLQLYCQILAETVFLYKQ